jgi:hypothetical protein
MIFLVSRDSNTDRRQATRGDSGRQFQALRGRAALVDGFLTTASRERLEARRAHKDEQVSRDVGPRRVVIRLYELPYWPQRHGRVRRRDLSLRVDRDLHARSLPLPSR